MDLSLIALLLGIGMLAALATGIWVAVALFSVALAAMMALVSAPAGPVLATTVWGASNSWDLTALPMFIWMGEILFRSRLSEDMFALPQPPRLGACRCPN